MFHIAVIAWSQPLLVATWLALSRNAPISHQLPVLMAQKRDKKYQSQTYPDFLFLVSDDDKGKEKTGKETFFCACVCVSIDPPVTIDLWASSRPQPFSNVLQHQILFSFSSDKDRRTDSRIRQKNTAQPLRESNPGSCECQFFYLCRSWKRREFD